MRRSLLVRSLLVLAATCVAGTTAFAGENGVGTWKLNAANGQDVPWPGNPVADTACPKKIDDSSYENVWKKGGKAVVTAAVSVSRDGKTLTVTQKGTDPQGAAITSVAVYEKQ